MTLIVYCGGGKTKGEWSSDNKKSRKKFYCDYCNKWKKKGVIYRWVDGFRSCDECNYDLKK